MWTWRPVWLPSSSLSLGNWDSSSRKFIDIHHGYSHNSNLRPHKRNVALLQKCCIPKAREWILWKNTWRLIYWEGIPSGVTGALSALSLFSLWVKLGAGLRRPPGRGPNRTRPLEISCLGFSMSKEHWFRENVWGDKVSLHGLNKWFMQLQHKLVVILLLDSAGLLCMEMMSYVCVCQVNTWSVVKNVMQIENEMESHRWHFLGLKTANLRSTCAQWRLSLYAWWDILKWRQGLMHHGHMHSEKSVCRPH